MTPAAIRRHLRRPDAWPRLQVCPCVGSTNAVLKGRAGAAAGTVLIALEQRAGRGRAGRSWLSPRGGLWLSALVPPVGPSEQASCLAPVTGLSLAEGLAEGYGLPVQVKWPNDLWLHRRKLGGILIELSSRGARLDPLVVGVGINVNNPLPAEVVPPPISLRQALGRALPLEEVAARVLDALAAGLERFRREGFEPFRERWARWSALEGRIAFRRDGQWHAGRVLALDELGRLVVETEAGPVRLTAEDVHLLGSSVRAVAPGSSVGPGGKAS